VAAAASSAFVTRLRKYLKSRRITSVAQIGPDRVIEIAFSDGQYRLYLEFFAAGNLIFTDKDYTVLAPLR
jgi:predicted ribosome quality control (RQC) complex YloA/Tae2 family protein